MATSYIPLEGKFTEAISGKTPTYNVGSSPSLFASTSFLYVLFFVVIVIAAASRYTIAGIWRMEASDRGIQKSNEIFKRVTFGLLGVFSLWLILSTVNKDLLTGDVRLSELRTNIDGGSASASNRSTSSSGMDNPRIPSNTSDDPSGWNAIRNDSTVRSQLNDAGITVNKRVCTTPAQTSCTTVGGLPQETISMLTQLRSACSGGIEITGGSEAGHSTHGPGKTPVDLSMNKPGNLNECIRAFPTTTAPSFCNRAYVSFGYTFCDEIGTPHWHVYK